MSQGVALGAAALVAAGAATPEGRVEGEVDVLLAVDAHHEGGDVDNLLANPAPPTTPQSDIQLHLAVTTSNLYHEEGDFAKLLAKPRIRTTRQSHTNTFVGLGTRLDYW